MDDASSVANLASIFGDEPRIRILDSLLKGPVTTSELVARLGLDQPRVSAHLAILRENGLVTVSVTGRQHVYSIKSKAVANTLEAIRTLAHSLPNPLLSPTKIRSRAAEREVELDSRLRQARTCYDHLAGVAGVELLDEMLRRGWIKERKLQSKGRERTLYDLTDQGITSLLRLGVRPPNTQKSRRIFGYGCLDWTERRHHLGGILGKAILERLTEQGIVVKTERESRAVKVRKPITQWLETSTHIKTP